MSTSMNYVHPVITVLRQFSDSKITALDAMSALGLQCHEDLFSATLEAGFDLPRLTDHEATIVATKALAFLGVKDA